MNLIILLYSFLLVFVELEFSYVIVVRVREFDSCAQTVVGLEVFIDHKACTCVGNMFTLHKSRLGA